MSDSLTLPDLGCDDPKCNGKIDILIGERTLIRLYDRVSGIRFAEVTLNADQLAAALGRAGMMPCRLTVRALKNVGKRREHKTLEFQMPTEQSMDKEVARALATAACPPGWTVRGGFSSQGSFWNSPTGPMARTMIYRYVEP